MVVYMQLGEAMPNSVDIDTRHWRGKVRAACGGGVLACLAIAACIAASYWALSGLDWRGDAQMHTETEMLATMLAFMAGCLAIVNYYSQRNALLLLLGAALLGTATLDGYHAYVTSDHFRHYMPSDMPSLIAWSWVASRWYCRCSCLHPRLSGG